MQGSVRSGEEGHQPLTQVAEHSPQQIHPNLPRQIQACLDSRMRLGARLGPAPLAGTNRHQVLSERLVCLPVFCLTLLLIFFPFVANPNAGPYEGVPPVTTGTVNPPYSIFSEKDPANPNATLQYQSITCMPQYRGNSFEVGIWYASLLSYLYSSPDLLYSLSSLFFHG